MVQRLICYAYICRLREFDYIVGLLVRSCDVAKNVGHTFRVRVAIGPVEIRLDHDRACPRHVYYILCYERRGIQHVQGKPQQVPANCRR